MEQCQNKETNKRSKLDDIVETTEALRQANVLIAKATQLLNEIPESFYHPESLGQAHWKINQNVEELEPIATLIKEHNEMRSKGADEQGSKGASKKSHTHPLTGPPAQKDGE